MEDLRPLVDDTFLGEMDLIYENKFENPKHAAGELKNKTLDRLDHMSRKE